MAKFPEPPATLPVPDLHVLRPGTRIWRIYFQAGAHPTTWAQFRSWGPTHARFDHHLPPPRLQPREILYGALGAKGALTCLSEAFQQSRVVERTRGTPALVAFDLTRPVRLLDLTGTWPTQAGASMAIHSGRRDRARRWSQAIYSAFSDVEGVLYPSSMNANEPCVALYERARHAMPSVPAFHRLLSDAAILSRLRRACGELGYWLL